MKMPKMKYVQVEKWIVNYVRNKTVLHLGCAGDYLSYGKNACLHYRISQVVSQLSGVELNHNLLGLIKEWVPESELIKYWHGDAETLEKLGINGKYDVVLAGSIIEHLSNPGKMLSGLTNYLNDKGELIIVTPNVFGLLQFIRVCIMRREAVNPEHTCWFSVQTLSELCARYNFYSKEWLTGYGWREPNFSWRVKLFFGIPFFKIFPWIGGSLIGVFQKSSECNENK